MSQNYEIEIKTLLGSKDNADSLREKITNKGGELVPEKSSKQLNHYFLADDYTPLISVMNDYIPEDRKELFKRAIEEGKGTSIRTREANGKVLFIVKASIDDQSSSNGVSRIEFEEEMPLSLEELDKILLDAGLTYQAKWSREREEYKLGETNISIDKNAGYGYLAEFERVLDDESLLASAKEDLLSLMNEFEVEELAQDRLERMFDFYNKNWQDYYGTDKIFNIE